MSFGTLALICLVALIGPLLSLPRRGGVPVVIGELAVGLVLGVGGLGVLDPNDQTFTFLGQMGFALVMFVAGTHVPIREPRMWANAGPGVLRAAVIGVCSVPAGFGLAALFGTDNGALYAVILASSSAAVVLPTLTTTRIESRVGLQMLSQVAVADAVCIVLLPLALEPHRAGRTALGAVVVLGLAAICHAVLRWVDHRGYERQIHKLSEKRRLAIELRVTLVLLFTLAAVASVMSVSVMLAGFALGLAVAAAGEPKRVGHQIFALTEGFFGPIFFVWVGATIDMGDLWRHPTMVGLGLLLGTGGLALHALGRLSGQPFVVGLSTAAQLGVPLAAVTVGTTTGVLAPGESSAFVVGSLVTLVAVTVVNGTLRRAVSVRP